MVCWNPSTWLGTPSLLWTMDIRINTLPMCTSDTDFFSLLDFCESGYFKADTPQLGQDWLSLMRSLPCMHSLHWENFFFWDKSNKLSVWPLKSYIDFDIGIDKEEEDLVCVFVILQDVIEPITLLEKHYVCSCCYLFQGPCFLQFFQHLEVRIIRDLIWTKKTW